MRRGVEGRDDGEQGGIDTVSPGRENTKLTPLFASSEEEASGVLEHIAFHELSENSFRRNGRATGGDDQGDFARGNDHDGGLRNAKLPKPITEVNARREGVG